MTQPTDSARVNCDVQALILDEVRNTHNPHFSRTDTPTHVALNSKCFCDTTFFGASDIQMKGRDVTSKTAERNVLCGSQASP